MSSIMVDWITAQVQASKDPDRYPLEPRLFDTGKFMKIDPTGEVLERFASRFVAQGSFDTSISFRAPTPNVLELSGNPAKFLQGHNLFGSSDKLGLLLTAGLETVNFSDRFLSSSDVTNRFPDPKMWQDFEFLVPKFTRIDLTRSYKFDSDAHAREWIRGCASSARSKHKGGLAHQGTVYFGQSSSRWAFKIYLKSDEINSKSKGHKLSEKLTSSQVQSLRDWSKGVVRFELTLRSPEIKKLPYEFDPLEVWESYFSRISFNENERLYAMDDLDALCDIEGNPMPGHLKMAVIAWRAGNDLRRIYSKNQYYRNLKALRSWGFDLSVPVFHSESQFLVNPKLDPLNFDPAPIQDLLFEPDPEIRHDFGLN